jgi:predicted DNA-binding protein (MmcQ/YjbR family)
MNKYPWLDSYLRAKAGAQYDYKVEWTWHRYLVGGKMFAAICQPEPKYQPHNGRELVSLKADPHMAELLRDEYPDIVPGFYLDKANWNSIYLDGEVPEDLLRRLVDISYSLVFNKLTKKSQQEIAGP